MIGVPGWRYGISPTGRRYVAVVPGLGLTVDEAALKKFQVTE